MNLRERTYDSVYVKYMYVSPKGEYKASVEVSLNYDFVLMIRLEKV